MHMSSSPREVPTPTNSPIGALFARGALLWALVAVVQVLVNGVVLDEVLTPAQIIAGVVQYPDGHPNIAYYKGVYSLSHYVAAGLLLLFHNVNAVAALYDVLFYFTTTFTVFAMTVALTRRPAWAHLSAGLTSAGIFVGFQGLYPLYVFPDYFSNGHLGTYAVILSVALLLARSWRGAGFLVGILPGIHLAMAAVAFPWMVLFLGWAKSRPIGANRRSFVRFLLVGLGFALVLAGLVAFEKSGARSVAPYDGTGDPAAIYRNFTILSDAHRQLMVPRSLGYLLNPLLFFTLGGLLVRFRPKVSDDSSREAASRIGWLLGFGAIIWTIVYGAYLYRIGIGLMPTPFEILMPFRFSNFTAVLLIPLVVTVLATHWSRFTERGAGLGLAVLALILAAGAIGLGRGQDGAPLHTFFALLGFALGITWMFRASRAGNSMLGVALLALVACVVWFILHERRELIYLAAGALPGILLGVLGQTTAEDVSHRGAPAQVMAGILLVASIGLVVVSISSAGRGDTFKTVSPFDRQVSEWLALHGRTDEPILPPMLPLSKLQPKTGHPTLGDWETLYILAYVPGLAGPVRGLVRDLYGMDYGDSAQLTRVCPNRRVMPNCPAWNDAWQQRSAADWRTLSRKYRFRLVLANSHTPLQLSRVIESPRWTLYEIKDSAATPPSPGGGSTR